LPAIAAPLRPSPASALADVELVFAGRGFERIDELHPGRLGPTGDVGRNAGTIADEPKHFALLHSVQQFLRLDDRSRTVDAANIEHGIRLAMKGLALLNVEAQRAGRHFLRL